MDRDPTGHARAVPLEACSFSFSALTRAAQSFDIQEEKIEPGCQRQASALRVEFEGAIICRLFCWVLDGPYEGVLCMIRDTGADGGAARKSEMRSDDSEPTHPAQLRLLKHFPRTHAYRVCQLALLFCVYLKG